MSELDRLRRRFGAALVWLLWLHVPAIALGAALLDRAPPPWWAPTTSAGGSGAPHR
jgi:hypothetical protein